MTVLQSRRRNWRTSSRDSRPSGWLEPVEPVVPRASLLPRHGLPQRPFAPPALFVAGLINYYGLPLIPAAPRSTHGLTLCQELLALMRLTLVACLLSLLATTSWAQDAPKEMLATLKIRGGAERSGDAETWGRYTRDDAVIMDTDGIARTKAQWMARIKNGPPGSRSAAHTGVFRVVVIGKQARTDGRAQRRT